MPELLFIKSKRPMSVGQVLPQKIDSLPTNFLEYLQIFEVIFFLGGAFVFLKMSVKAVLPLGLYGINNCMTGLSSRFEPKGTQIWAAVICRDPESGPYMFLTIKIKLEPTTP